MPYTPINNDFLLQHPSEINIKQVIMRLENNKSLGSDGFSLGFYKTYWNTYSADITSEIKDFFANGCLQHQITYTNIILIPKKDDPKFFKDHRPISLTNVRYKIIAKLLANKLKPILNNYIDKAHHAFLQNRNINHAIGVVHEITNSFNNNKSKKGFMGLKIDFQKAFDTVNLDYLYAILIHMGFHSQFINLIKACTLGVNYQIKVNMGYTKRLKWVQVSDKDAHYCPFYLFLFWISCLKLSIK